MNATVYDVNIETRVLAVVKDVLAMDEFPAMDSDLSRDLGADSLDLLSLFMALEDEFGGTIPEQEVERISTLRDVVAYIQGRMEVEGRT